MPPPGADPPDDGGGLPPGDVAAAVARARRLLAAAGHGPAPLEARMLVGHGLGLNADAVVTAGGRPLPPAAWTAIAGLLARRCRGEPIAHIVGAREFWSLSFRCGPSVLIPRPDSETLIEAALAWRGRREPPGGRSRRRPPRPLRLLDLGTGSGCLLLTLLHLWPSATGIGVDISKAALALARDNAERLGVGARARFVCGDWAAAILGRFDLVVSNPPYVSRPELARLAPEVALWEPRGALDGGADGLDHYRAIVPVLGRLLASGGAAILETGHDQAAAVACLARRAGFQDIEVSRDLAGAERCLRLSRQGGAARKKVLGNQAVPV